MLELFPQHRPLCFCLREREVSKLRKGQDCLLTLGDGIQIQFPFSMQLTPKVVCSPTSFCKLLLYLRDLWSKELITPHFLFQRSLGKVGKEICTG